ncbi:MAG: Xaa-Pro peptidase family protein [Candidatus Latescibacterota bacterium]|nr:Xaa-Pro peptidase family protein [Candidatus Latescibacterota bacterium]
MSKVLCNRQRALDYMGRADIDAIVATSPVNVTYFTGYYCWLNGQFKKYMVKPGGSGELLPLFGVFSAKGESALVVDAALAVNAMDVEGLDLWVFGGGMFDRSGEVSALEGRQREVYELLADVPIAETAVEALVGLLQEQKLDGARIGLEADGLPAGTQAAIEGALPGVEFKDCSNLIRLVRMVKTPEEIGRMARGAVIGEEAALASLADARAGCSMSEVGQQFRVEVGARGADLDHFAFGVKGMGLATEADYVLGEDDALYVDYGCVYQYYCSDSGLTLALSPLSDDWARKYEALRECLDAGSRAMIPGARASVVPAAMWDVLHEYGISASFPHGHGLGLEVRDYPILVANTGLRVCDDCVDEPADLPLETDMVLNLEAMVFVLGVASVHIEQSFVVGADGGRALTAQDRSRPFYLA